MPFVRVCPPLPFYRSGVPGKRNQVASFWRQQMPKSAMFFASKTKWPFHRVDINKAEYFWQWNARTDQVTISCELLSVENFASFAKNTIFVIQSISLLPSSSAILDFTCRPHMVVTCFQPPEWHDVIFPRPNILSFLLENALTLNLNLTQTLTLTLNLTPFLTLTQSSTIF